MEALRDQDLARVLQPDADLASDPLTPKERLYTTLLFIHIHSVFRAYKEKMLSIPPAWYADIADFASLPVAKVVWLDVKRVQDKAFVTFIEKAGKNQSQKQS